MTVRFKQNSHLLLEVPCYLKLNLLAHAQLEELSIGSRCGGFGQCGGDRIRVELNSPLNSPTELEAKHLSASELKEGLRLACQCYPNQDDAEITVELVGPISSPS